MNVRMPIDVQLISAKWCKRCVTVKPDVSKYCEMTGAALTVLDMDDMEDSEKTDIKSLPTIRMKTGTEWVTYTADTLENWKTAIMQASIASSEF